MILSFAAVEQSAADHARCSHRFALRASGGLFVTTFLDGYMCIQKNRAQAWEHMIIEPHNGRIPANNERTEVLAHLRRGDSVRCRWDFHACVHLHCFP